MKKELQKKYDDLIKYIKENGYHIEDGKIEKSEKVYGVYVSTSTYSHKAHGDCYFDCISWLTEPSGEFHMEALNELREQGFFDDMYESRDEERECKYSFEFIMSEAYGKTDIPNPKIVDKMYEIYDDVYGYFLYECPSDSEYNVTFLHGESNEGLSEKYPEYSWKTFSANDIPF
jgi:hypothetical protein